MQPVSSPLETSMSDAFGRELLHRSRKGWHIVNLSPIGSISDNELLS